MTSPRPNVVLVVFDTARATAFEPWGAPPGATPTMAQLASRGAAVPHAVAACSWTLPSHAAMFTGSLPRSIGLTLPPGAPLERCDALMGLNRDRLLPEVLRRAGYHTAAMSANPWIDEFHGFGIGFDRFVQIKGRRSHGIDDRRWRARLRWAYEALIANVDDGAAAATQVVDGWLAAAPAQPFFWFVNLIECHSPYLPPRPWNDLGALARLRAGGDARRFLTHDAIWRGSAGGFDIPDEAVERMRHLYGRSVSLMDAWLARLLTQLDERKLLDDTIVIVTSDHGENLGECQLIGHAFSLSNRLIHVPLVVAGPDPLPMTALYSTVDLPRTIGGAVGLLSNPWAHDGDVAGAGVAVAQYDAVIGADDPRLEEGLARWGLGEEARFALTQPMTAVTDGRRKLVRHGDRLCLYDLQNDPDEAAPLDPGACGAGDELAALAGALARADATDADPEAVIAVMSAGPGGVMTESLEAQMRLLGYL